MAHVPRSLQYAILALGIGIALTQHALSLSGHLRPSQPPMKVEQGVSP